MLCSSKERPKYIFQWPCHHQTCEGHNILRKGKANLHRRPESQDNSRGPGQLLRQSRFSQFLTGRFWPQAGVRRGRRAGARSPWSTCGWTWSAQGSARPGSRPRWTRSRGSRGGSPATRCAPGRRGRTRVAGTPGAPWSPGEAGAASSWWGWHPGGPGAAPTARYRPAGCTHAISGRWKYFKMQIRFHVYCHSRSRAYSLT